MNMMVVVNVSYASCLRERGRHIGRVRKEGESWVICFLVFVRSIHVIVALLILHSYYSIILHSPRL